MREGWEVKKLGQVSNVQRGLTYGRNDTVDISENIVLRATNIKLESNSLDFNDLKYLTDDFEIKDIYKLKVGSLLICFSSGSKNHLGKVAIVEEPYAAAFGGFIGQITPNEIVIPRYLFYNLISDNYRKYISELTDGMNINNLKSGDLKQFPIPIPPIQEQKQIVALLDQAFTAIDQAKANIEKNIVNAKELFQSKLNAIFSQKGEGWEEKTLGELGKVSMCKRILKNQTTHEGDIPFYKIGTFGKEANAFIPKEIYDDFISKYSFPKKGDILLSASGTIGRRVIYDGKPAYFQDSNIVWIDNNEELVTNEYLYQFYGVCDWNPSKGATISRLYNSDLRRINISFPSIKEQKQIVPNIAKLSEQTIQIESNYIKKLEDLEELKKSILKKAFLGELTQKEVVV
jgi:type I restriction enzyme S subunit